MMLQECCLRKPCQTRGLTQRDRRLHSLHVRLFDEDLDGPLAQEAHVMLLERLAALEALDPAVQLRHIEHSACKPAAGALIRCARAQDGPASLECEVYGATAAYSTPDWL